MGSRFKARIEQNKKVLGVLLQEVAFIKSSENFIQTPEKIKINRLEKVIKNRIFELGWSFVDITSILVKIKYKMDYEKFVDIYQQYNDDNICNYGNWSLSNVIQFLSELSFRYTETLNQILKEYEESDIYDQ